MCKKKILIAGFGSYYRGDDSLGIRVVQELRGNECVKIVTSGVEFVQELLSEKYDLVIVADAIRRGGKPGSFYFLEVEEVLGDTDFLNELAYLHILDPSSSLSIAKELGVLPTKIYVLGCEPKDVNSLEISDEVRECMNKVVRKIEGLLFSFS